MGIIHFFWACQFRAAHTFSLCDVVHVGNVLTLVATALTQTHSQEHSI